MWIITRNTLYDWTRKHSWVDVLFVTATEKEHKKIKLPTRTINVVSNIKYAFTIFVKMNGCMNICNFFYSIFTIKLEQHTSLKTLIT